MLVNNLIIKNLVILVIFYEFYDSGCSGFGDSRKSVVSGNFEESDEFCDSGEYDDSGEIMWSFHYSGDFGESGGSGDFGDSGN